MAEISNFVANQIHHPLFPVIIGIIQMTNKWVEAARAGSLCPPNARIGRWRRARGERALPGMFVNRIIPTIISLTGIEVRDSATSLQNLFRKGLEHFRRHRLRARTQASADGLDIVSGDFTGLIAP
jgi:hypothetical protein